MTDRQTVDRIVDVASVILISAAAVFSALCSYQSGRWSGDQNRLYNSANVQWVHAAMEFNRASSLGAVNAGLFLAYVSAMQEGNREKTEFIYRRLGSRMRGALDQWLETKPLLNPHAPVSPFDMPAYHDWFENAGKPEQEQATRDFNDAQNANRTSDSFLLLTVIFAGVSFLGGMSTKMTYPKHLIVILIGTAALLYGIVRIVSLPFL